MGSVSDAAGLGLSVEVVTATNQSVAAIDFPSKKASAATRLHWFVIVQIWYTTSRAVTNAESRFPPGTTVLSAMKVTEDRIAVPCVKGLFWLAITQFLPTENARRRNEQKRSKMRQRHFVPSPCVEQRTR